MCVCMFPCVCARSQAAHCGVIAASEFGALDYGNLLPWECRALWENRKPERVCVDVCLCVRTGVCFSSVGKVYLLRTRTQYRLFSTMHSIP